MSTRMSQLFVIGIGILVCLLLQCEEVHGRDYQVGGAEGWRADPSITDWPKGWSFKAGDVLYFNYPMEDRGLDVVALKNSNAYNNCNINLDPNPIGVGYNVVLQQGTTSS